MLYPAWTLGIAAVLATSSLVPIILGLVTEALRGQDRREARTNRFFRVDTAASTRPMLGEFQVDSRVTIIPLFTSDFRISLICRSEQRTQTLMTVKILFCPPMREKNMNWRLWTDEGVMRML